MTSYRVRISIIICIVFTSTTHFAQNNAFEYFITASGSKFMNGEKELRFISWNIPNLNFVEDKMDFLRDHAYGLPTANEIRDALESVVQMGGQVVRIYTIPVWRETDVEGVPKYVLAPGKFNERAFTTMDTMLALANEIRIRLIIPLLNAWKWMGGRPQYAAFRGKSQEEFWTDPQLIDDFKKTVRYVLSRKNSITGIPYREDKAILCWETGNELPCPHSWTHEIATTIKQWDANHLVMDGYNAFDGRLIREASLTDPAVDIVTSHHYATNPSELFQHIEANLDLVRSRKPYVIGEFGFLGTPCIEKVLDWVIEKDIAGALVWSLRYHRDRGGFYWHSEPLGLGVFKAYHWPGFCSGEEYDEKNLLAIMRQSAFGIQNLPEPPLTIPKAPQLLPIETVAHISWFGSSGASGYDVERSTDPNGPWSTVGMHVSDATVQYMPLFHDKSAEIGQSYYYRIIAKNKAGTSEASNVRGPVSVLHQALIDEMGHYARLYTRQGKWRIARENDRQFKEDMERMEGDTGSALVYRVAGTIFGWNIYSFTKDKGENLRVFLSQDGKSYQSAESDLHTAYQGEGDYDYWRPVLYRVKNQSCIAHYCKIELKAKSQIGRVEIFYGKK